MSVACGNEAGGLGLAHTANKEPEHTPGVSHAHAELSGCDQKRVHLERDPESPATHLAHDLGALAHHALSHLSHYR